MSEIRVNGLKALGQFLQTLPAKLEANVLRSALREGAKVIEQEVKSNLQGNGSVDTGRLRDSIRVSTRSRRGKVYATIKAGGRSGKKTILVGKNGRVRAGYQQAFYAHWVEYGTAAHKIKPRTHGGFLSFGDVIVRGVDHPGARPKPFMRPALRTKAQDAVVAAANYMKRRLQTRHGLDTAGIDVEAA